jgi:hypothetical protein
LFNFHCLQIVVVVDIDDIADDNDADDCHLTVHPMPYLIDFFDHFDLKSIQIATAQHPFASTIRTHRNDSKHHHRRHFSIAQMQSLPISIAPIARVRYSTRAPRRCLHKRQTPTYAQRFERHEFSIQSLFHALL